MRPLSAQRKGGGGVAVAPPLRAQVQHLQLELLRAWCSRKGRHRQRGQHRPLLQRRRQRHRRQDLAAEAGGRQPQERLRLQPRLRLSARQHPGQRQRRQSQGQRSKQQQQWRHRLGLWQRLLPQRPARNQVQRRSLGLRCRRSRGSTTSRPSPGRSGPRAGQFPPPGPSSAGGAAAHAASQPATAPGCLNSSAPLAASKGNGGS